MSTAGSSFTTLLAAYTGAAVSNLTCVGSDINSTGGTNRSRVTFNTLGGVTYHIAVDGYNGASSRIALSLSFTGALVRPQLSQMTRLANGSAQFLITGEANQQYIIEVSTDLLTWDELGSVTTSGAGTVTVSDSGALGLDRRFYRVRLP